MEQLSFSPEPNEKLFFLGALAGLGKMGAAAGRAAAGKAAASAAKKAVIPKPKIPVKISTGDINIGNKQQQEN
jgi:hypothetical protein